MKSKAASSTGVRVAGHNSGELINLVGYFSLANTLPFSALILGLSSTGGVSIFESHLLGELRAYR